MTDNLNVRDSGKNLKSVLDEIDAKEFDDAADGDMIESGKSKIISDNSSTRNLHNV